MNGVITLQIGDTIMPSPRVVEGSRGLKALLRQCKHWNGTIVTIAQDGEAYPIRVEFESGKRYWFDPHEVERVEK